MKDKPPSIDDDVDAEDDQTDVDERFPASIALLVSGPAGLFLYQAYYRRLEKANLPARGRRHKA